MYTLAETGMGTGTSTWDLRLMVVEVVDMADSLSSSNNPPDPESPPPPPPLGALTGQFIFLRTTNLLPTTNLTQELTQELAQELAAVSIGRSSSPGTVETNLNLNLNFQREKERDRES